MQQNLFLKILTLFWLFCFREEIPWQYKKEIICTEMFAECINVSTTHQEEIRGTSEDIAAKRET